MAKSLVIVESPAKAKTISKYLGKNYIVKSSVGHIRDLPTSGSGTKPNSSGKTSTAGLSEEDKAADKFKKAQNQLIRRMAIDPSNKWEASYEILPGKEKVLKDLKKSAEEVDTIYLATDLDREGEAIAWHLQEAIGGERSRYKRVTFSEITKNAIKEAFDKPGDLNLNRVNAQQARRFLDRVVGFMVSPLLWAKVARGLSAGRVQSVAVRLIRDREQEIRIFKPEEYWKIHAHFNPQKSFKAELVKYRAKPFQSGSKAETDKALDFLTTAQYKVSKKEEKPTSSKPSAPFKTSTLQQAASTRLSFGVKKTMVLAQRLYEAGFITYMRTDSTNISDEALTSCRDYIDKTYGSKYLPENANAYSNKKGAQEAHEAIRPSDIAVTPKSIEDQLEKDQIRLYQLIWSQFIACQMTPATFDTTTLIVSAGDYDFKVRGKVRRFDGWQRILYPIIKKGDEDLSLPDIAVNDVVTLEKIIPKQHFTMPLPRFTEAALVGELENQGIGRPSTYAAIISTIQDRGYVRVEHRKFYLEKMGDIVTDRLVENFSDLMDFGFTANMEGHLDDIANGKSHWHNVLDDFYKKFVAKLEQANGHMRTCEPTETSIACPKCQRHMCIRTARSGVFLSCSGYVLNPKERCKATINLVNEDDFVNDQQDDEADAREILHKRRCKICDYTMDSYLVDEGRKLHVCSKNPDCNGFEIEQGKFKIKGYEGPVINCDKCDKEMQLKTGRFGKYFSCNDYPTCKNTRKLLKNGEAAPPRSDPIPMPELPCEKSDGHFVLRDGAAGIFLASNNFPKSRETRNPLVEDLIRHKSELDPKYWYLTEAIPTDPDGNKSKIKFSRKEKTHYIMSEKEGKPTGWSLLWENNRWVEQVISKATKKGT